MEQNLLVPKRSIKPYTKDRTKMTITKDDLRPYTKRDTLRRIANAIEFYSVSYNALPAYEQNEADRERYLEALLKEVLDMAKEVENVA